MQKEIAYLLTLTSFFSLFALGDVSALIAAWHFLYVASNWNHTIYITSDGISDKWSCTLIMCMWGQNVTAQLDEE